MQLPTLEYDQDTSVKPQPGKKHAVGFLMTMSQITFYFSS